MKRYRIRALGPTGHVWCTYTVLARDITDAAHIARVWPRVLVKRVRA